MKMLLFALSLALMCCQDLSAAYERRICNGFAPAVSPDGGKVAFQRVREGRWKLGVLDVRSGAVEWIETDGAADPCWLPNGALVYSYGAVSNDVGTLWKNRATDEGCRLRMWEKGAKRDLTDGCASDRMAAASADGKTLYFATTRGRDATDSRPAFLLAYLPFAGGAAPTVVANSISEKVLGIANPAPSPDGASLVWGCRVSADTNGWCLCGARIADLGDLRKRVLLTPCKMAATSPRWHPDGTLIVFNGFMPGDDCWGVWVMDMRTFGLRRLADGGNATFTPDGKWLLYDREDRIYLRMFSDRDRPTEKDVVPLAVPTGVASCCPTNLPALFAPRASAFGL